MVSQGWCFGLSRGNWLLVVQLAKWGLVLLGIPLFGLLATNYVSSGREDARRAQCKGNMKQIAWAISVYHDVHGSLPPAYIADADGNPMHSWRLLVLPFVGDSRFNQRYDFAEPWNGPNNSRLARSPFGKSYARIFSCPSEGGDEGSEMTNFVAVTGAETLWPGNEPRDLSQAEWDANPGKIMVIEFAGSDIHWLEPRDLTIEQAIRGANRPGHGISSPHAVEIHYTTLNGAVNSLDKNEIGRMRDLLQVSYER